ncbi:ABC transporter ATP-binding protein [Achromatium sp. WMS3]|nr:ABC transporter ATP-binding protein [Achromatium sp. WMS3]
MNAPLLHITDLTTQLGNPKQPSQVVDKVNLEIYPGETFALLGESGCGKSMTALSIMRLLPLSGRIIEGCVQFSDVGDLLDLPEKEMRRIRGGQMAMIFQEPQTSLNPVMTVGRQIAEAVELHDVQRKTNSTKRVIELLDAVGIPDPKRRAKEYPHQLSGGMKQRIMIAMALAGKPKLLIADEPTTALDVTIQAQVLKLLKDLQQDTGMAVLLITHDLGVVAETADRLAVMYAGQIVETATSERFFSKPGHPYGRKLLKALPDASKRKQRLAVIPGMVPSLKQKFSNCRFVKRCDVAIAECSSEIPPWVFGSNNQQVRCHIWQSDTNKPLEQSILRNQDSGVLNDSSQDLHESQDFNQDNKDNQVNQGSKTLDQPSNNILLEARDLCVHFPIYKGILQRIIGHVRAVDGLSLNLYPGRTLALVGESGCGKTTAGKAILQLLRPTAGSVRFAGQELTSLSTNKLRPLRSMLQIIFQDPFASMNPRMLVGDIVAEGLIAQGLNNRSTRRAKVLKLLDQVGIASDAIDRYPHEFSGGQRQRICIARALAVEPSLIVCDEPTSALDVSVQAQIINLLKDLQINLDISYLFITHNISVVAYLADEVAVMYLGRIVEQGEVHEILEHPKHPYTKALLSAVPTIDDTGKQRIQLEGDLPSPADPPSGCHFHPRCPEATAACSLKYPDTVILSPTHSVRCEYAKF